MSAALSAEEITSALSIVGVIGESIRELGQVPSGHLYAVVMSGGMDLAQYEQAIGLLKRSKLVAEDASHMLTWTGPGR